MEQRPLYFFSCFLRFGSFYVNNQIHLNIRETNKAKKKIRIDRPSVANTSPHPQHTHSLSSFRMLSSGRTSVKALYSLLACLLANVDKALICSITQNMLASD